MEYNFKEYIDKWVTQKLKDDKKDTRFKLDEYIQNKIDCFNDSRNTVIADLTKITYFRILAKHVHKHELALGKDLKYFTPPQVETVISGIVSYSYMTKRSAYAALAYYFNWCVIRKEISYNPCDSIDTTGLFEVNARVAKSQYMPLEDFYLYLDSLECTDVEKMIYTLVRYGVPMSSVPSVRWSDVDTENMMLNTIVKNNEVSLPIDEEFVRRVNLAKQCKGRGDNKDGSIRIAYVDTGYIIKYKNEEKTRIPYLYGIIERVSKVSNVGKLDMGMLTKNRRYDFALEKYEENGVITMNDLRDILYKCGFSSTASQVSVLKKELKNIFDLNVKSKRTNKPIDVIDIYTGEVIKTYKTAKLLTQNSKKDLGFYVDKTLVVKICKEEKGEFKGLTFRYAEQE